jgi:threonine dehydratase
MSAAMSSKIVSLRCVVFDATTSTSRNVAAIRRRGASAVFTFDETPPLMR